MSSAEIPPFSALALSEPVQQAIARVGYELPSPIQAACIPQLLEGHDLVGVAQTGTGKTAAFALPFLSRIDLTNKAPQLLVLTPTRELAIQVAEAFQTYASEMKGFHVLPVYGGQDMRGQLRQLDRGVHVVVGTPGRIMDHLRRKTLDLTALQGLVLDEADEMLRMGFIEDVEWILEHTPGERQVALFSATMPKPIRKVAERYLTNPREVSIASQTKTAERIEQYFLNFSGFEKKLDGLTRILEVEDFDAMIIFVRTKTATSELAEKLEARGYAATALNGDMNQALRERAINRLKNGKLDIVVATDVAARGIDVERISHVVNFDIPYDSEAYVHRIGRTGRAGRAGKAILFVAPREKRLLQSIEKATRQPIKPMGLPSGADVAAKRVANFTQAISEVLNTENLDFYYDLLADYSNAENRSPEEIACALAYLLQKDKPLQVSVADQKRDKQAQRDNIDTNADTKAERYSTKGDYPVQLFRIEVGKRDGVKPGDIVALLSAEAGIEKQYIGYIKLYGEYSTVEMPAGMPKEVMQHLQALRLCDRPLLIKQEKATGKPAGATKRRKPAQGKKKQGNDKKSKTVRKRAGSGKKNQG